MLGAIVGDIVGSRFEFNSIKTKDFELFHKNCQYTDDTVLTLAVCQALLDCRDNPEMISSIAARNLRALTLEYYRCSYGNRFLHWVYNEGDRTLNSCGNGAAMRVSGCAYAAKSVDEVRSLSSAVTAVSHSHPEGIKGAQATAEATYMALTGASQAEIEQMI